MPAVADLPLTAWVVTLPDEFHGPVDYQSRWLWFAVLGLLALIAYYVAVLLLTRRRPAPPPPPPTPVSDLRTTHLGRIEEVAEAVHAGRCSPREGHQQLSEIVRSYVERITPLPATTMTLADFRMRAPRPLTEMIEVMYPPEFAPDDVGDASARFEHALHQARGVVGTWRR